MFGRDGRTEVVRGVVLQEDPLQGFVVVGRQNRHGYPRQQVEEGISGCPQHMRGFVAFVLEVEKDKFVRVDVSPHGHRVRQRLRRASGMVTQRMEQAAQPASA